MKKYSAHITGYKKDSYGVTSTVIQVDSEQEAKLWCSDNSIIGEYNWHLDYMNPNKKEGDYGNHSIKRD